MKYKGWEIFNNTLVVCPFKFVAREPSGDYPHKYGNSVDKLIEEIDEEQDEGNTCGHLTSA